MALKPAPTLVALRALGLGDLLTGVPALRALARAFPRHRRLLLAPEWLAPLVALLRGADGQASFEVVARDSLHRAPGMPVHADVAVNLHGRGPQSHGLLRSTGAGRLIAFGDPASGHSGPAWRTHEHEVTRWCRLLEESGVPTLGCSLALDPPDPGAWSAYTGATLLHPGAGSESRRWPALRYVAVAAAEAARGRRVLVTGSPADRDVAERIARRAGLGPGAVLAGGTGLAELAGLVAAVGRVVCGDTGMGHLATAVGTPSVVLFGPTPPDEWGPPSGRTIHRPLWAGRRGDPHADRVDPGLLDIQPASVLRELRRLDRLVGDPA